MFTYRRKAKVLFLVLMAICFVLAGCGQSTLKPEDPQTKQQQPKPQQSKPEGSEKNPVASNEGPKAKSNSSVEDWTAVVEAAKKEGKLVISGAPGEIWRKALVDAFEKKYPGIKIDYIGLNGRDFMPRILKEREVGQYLWDLRVGGANPAVYKGKETGVFEPVRDYLLPEIAVDDKWLGGLDNLFIDKENKFFAGFLANANYPITVNRDVISEKELSSPKQLLDPKFAGKIVINDPNGGAGLGSLAVLMADYGEDYVKDLLSKQKLVSTKDTRQMTEWLVRGRYPIAIGGDDSNNLYIFQKEGVGLNVKFMEEGPIKLSTGFGSVQLLNKAPHQNAAKVYLNWLLSQEGQSNITQLLELNSKRVDVKPGDPATVIKKENLKRYIPHQSEEYEPVRSKAQKLAEQLLK